VSKHITSIAFLALWDRQMRSATCTVANSTYWTTTYIITVILPYLLHFYFELQIYAIFASCYFLEISDDCKFCTIIDRNFNFSGNANLLVYCSARRKEHLTVHYGWHGNAMKMSQIYSFLCDRPILAFCFNLLGFFYNCEFLPTIDHVPILLTNIENFEILASDIYLLVFKNH